MIRSGVPERIAMSLSGHKTQSMLYRYCLINEEVQRAALRRTQEFRASDQDRVVAMPSARVQ
jgi:hypothetical protein